MSLIKSYKMSTLVLSTVALNRAVDLRSVTCGIFPLNFRRWLTGRYAETGRCPVGCRRMSKIGEASSGDRANFNCELNLPGRPPISAR